MRTARPRAPCARWRRLRAGTSLDLPAGKHDTGRGHIRLRTRLVIERVHDGFTPGRLAVLARHPSRDNLRIGDPVFGTCSNAVHAVAEVLNSLACAAGKRQEQHQQQVLHDGTSHGTNRTGRLKRTQIRASILRPVSRWRVRAIAAASIRETLARARAVLLSPRTPNCASFPPTHYVR